MAWALLLLPLSSPFLLSLISSVERTVLFCPRRREVLCHHLSLLSQDTIDLLFSHTSQWRSSLNCIPLPSYCVSELKRWLRKSSKKRRYKCVLFPPRVKISFLMSILIVQCRLPDLLTNLLSVYLAPQKEGRNNLVIYFLYLNVYLVTTQVWPHILFSFSCSLTFTNMDRYHHQYDD